MQRSQGRERLRSWSGDMSGLCLQKVKLFLLEELLQLMLGAGSWSLVTTGPREKDSREVWKSAELCAGVCVQTGSAWPGRELASCSD